MGAREDTEEERVNWHWRNSMRPVRFFNLDARTGIAYFILIVHFRPYTLFFAIVVTLVFMYLERKGLYFDAALRSFRAWFWGQSRPAWLSFRKRKMRDYG